MDRKSLCYRVKCETLEDFWALVVIFGTKVKKAFHKYFSLWIILHIYDIKISIFETDAIWDTLFKTVTHTLYETNIMWSVAWENEIFSNKFKCKLNVYDIAIKLINVPLLMLPQIWLNGAYTALRWNYICDCPRYFPDLAIKEDVQHLKTCSFYRLQNMNVTTHFSYSIIQNRTSRASILIDITDVQRTCVLQWLWIWVGILQRKSEQLPVFNHFPERDILLVYPWPKKKHVRSQKTPASLSGIIKIRVVYDFCDLALSLYLLW